MNGTDIFICENCGTVLQEIDGKEQCYICGEGRESLTQHQIWTQIERAKKWIFYGAYDEAEKEISVLEQHQIGGSTIYLLKLMMDMQVATQEELQQLSVNLQENIYFQKILKCSKEHPEDYTGGIVAEYSQKAVQNKEEKDTKTKQKFKIASYVAAAFLTLAFDSAVSPYRADGLYTKFWIVWILTLGTFFGRKKIPEKYRKFVYIALGIIWVCFYVLWCNVIAKYGEM